MLATLPASCERRHILSAEAGYKGPTSLQGPLRWGDPGRFTMQGVRPGCPAVLPVHWEGGGMRFRNESLALAVVAVFVVAVAALVFTTSADAGSQELHSGYKVLAPITHDNLTIFPVVSNNTHDTATFLTLDEGL